MESRYAVMARFAGGEVKIIRGFEGKTEAQQFADSSVGTTIVVRRQPDGPSQDKVIEDAWINRNY